MLELISTYGLGTVIIILLIGIPAVINFITWCKNLWGKRQKFVAENQRIGHLQAEAEDAEEQRFASGETRIGQLELLVKQQAELYGALKSVTDRLEQSDKLAIKTYIKEQHDFWVPRGCIDGQVLELLEERFEIYQEEGGNSWAEKLMNDMRALPTISIVGSAEIYHRPRKDTEE